MATAATNVRRLEAITDTALAHLSLDALLDELLARVRTMLAADTAAILLLEPETETLVARAAKGLEEEVERGVRIPVGGGFAGRIAADGTPVMIEDVDHAEVLNPLLRAKGIRSLLGVPLRCEGHVIGVLHVGSLRRRSFDQADAQLLQVVGDRIALGIEFARLYEAEREARDQIEAARSELDDFFENAPVGLHWVGPDGTLLRANRAELELLGYAAEEYMGRHIAEFHADRAQIDDILARLARGETVSEYEARLRCKDGSIRYVLIDSNVLWDDGRFVHTRCFTRDITARKRAEAERDELLARERAAREEAERANRTKDEFLATVSHELRTPLTPILAWARMLRLGKIDPAAAPRALETIERNAKSEAQLVEDILDVSRITTGKLRLDVRPLRLADVIRAAVESLRPAAEAKELHVEVALDPRAGPSSGDAERLQQVVWNLLSNAIKFTSKGGRVQVLLERINSHLELTVRDTGKGISADFLPYVFDRFRQADSKMTRVQPGLGLGLAIVRHLVELHGGTVSASSPGEEKGAVFTVRLPLTVSRPAVADEKPAYPAEGVQVGEGLPALDGVRVLAVDDEPDTRDVIRDLLERCGAEVRTASSTAEARAVLEDWPPDILIADIGMPGEDGYALIRAVRAREEQRGGRVLAVALTAYARVEDRLKVLSRGFQMHVPKPVEPMELAAVVASLAESIGKLGRPA